MTEKDANAMSTVSTNESVADTTKRAMNFQLGSIAILSADLTDKSGRRPAKNLRRYIIRVTTLVTTSATAHTRLRLSQALRRIARPNFL